MAIPDVTWTQLNTRLADNGEGAISEEDIRAVGQFARTSYAKAVADGVDIGNWSGTVNIPGAYTEAPRYALLLGLDTSSKSEHWLSAGTTGFSYSGSGGGGDSLTATRLMEFSWRVELWATSLQSVAVAWYLLPSGQTWPTTNAKRIVRDMLWHVNGTNSANYDRISRNSVDGYIVKGSGSETITLAPGDQLVPVLEHYGPDAGTPGSPKLTFSLNVHSVGVVDAWSIPAGFMKTMAGDDLNGTAGQLLNPIVKAGQIV